jgi:hypothetical protein
MYYAHVDGGVLYNTTYATNVMFYLHVSQIICMYCIFDSYSLELYTMYDSHGVLRVLYIIYMYKFSRCYVIIFHYFSFHLPIFSKN